MNHEYHVGWFTLMVINACMAHAFVRSRAMRLSLSLLLGPIATILLLCFGTEKYIS